MIDFSHTARVLAVIAADVIVYLLLVLGLFRTGGTARWPALAAAAGYLALLLASAMGPREPPQVVIDRCDWLARCA